MPDDQVPPSTPAPSPTPTPTPTPPTPPMLPGGGGD